MGLCHVWFTAPANYQQAVGGKTMFTLRDLVIVYSEIDLAISLFGASEDIIKRFYELADAARDAVVSEQGLKGPDEALRLPLTTPLGEKATAAMEALKSLCPQR